MKYDLSFTFMIANNMINRSRSEDFSEHIEKPIHDSTISFNCRLPNTVIAHVTSVINHVGIGMDRLNSSKRIFDGSPWAVALYK